SDDTHVDGSRQCGHRVRGDGKAPVPDAVHPEPLGVEDRHGGFRRDEGDVVTLADQQSTQEAADAARADDCHTSAFSIHSHAASPPSRQPTGAADIDLGTGGPYWYAQWMWVWLASERGCAGMDGSPTVGQDGGMDALRVAVAQAESVVSIGT